MPLSEDLKPCPFCGGEAESEWYRDYRHIRSGEVGRSIAVYCTACHADMTICRADVPELSAADIMATLIEAWNTRSEQRSKAEASPEEKDANSPPD
jgi:Lar family restriction alleviation protein